MANDKNIVVKFRTIFSKYVQSLLSEYKNIVLENFDKEKDIDGDNFAPLRPATVRSRGGATGPILKRTGNLRNSFIAKVKNHVDMSFKNTAYYSSYLREGRHNMESRDFLSFPESLAVGTPKRDQLINELSDELDSVIVKACVDSFID